VLTRLSFPTTETGKFSQNVFAKGATVFAIYKFFPKVGQSGSSDPFGTQAIKTA
jgi:hypothetical protein